MRWFRESTWITSSFIITLFVTGAMSFTSYQNSVQLVNSINETQQTNDVLDALTDISALLATIESRQWSYILLKDTEELTRYKTSVERLHSVFEQLRQPLADTPVQLQRLDELEQLVDEQLNLFEGAIAQFNDSQPEILPNDSLITSTRINLNQIHQIIIALEEKEEELITTQLEAIRTSSQTRMIIELVGTVSAFMILLGAFGLLYRQLHKRQRAEAAQQALAQAKELSELKLQLFSMVSHEFRTPLSLILGSSQLLEEGIKDVVEMTQLKNLYRIQSSAKTMTQLLNDILMVARADAGKLEFSPKWIEIQTFCLNLIEDFQVSQPMQRSLSFTSKGDRTHAYIDEKLLYSILNNLLSNAVKFSPKRSTIYFTVIGESDAVIFQVRDEGVGIPDDDKSMLYTPFSRGSNTQNIRGTGLGLAVVQRCLALHGGIIAMDSTVGIGTTFTVTFPQEPYAPTSGYQHGLRGIGRSPH